MKPFYCRLGSKTRLLKYILPLIPSHTTYVEPFVGSGAVFWGKEPSKIEILNDLDKELIDAYKLLKKKTPVQLTIPYLKNMEEYNDFYENAPNTANNKIFKAIMKYCGTYGNKTTGKIYRFDISKKVKNYTEYKNRLKNVKLYNLSYETILDKYDNYNTFFYLDPPYELSTEKKINYKNIDLIELRNMLQNLKGKWLLSLNDSPNIRQIFKNYNIQIVKIKPMTGETNIGNKARTELLIRNY
jgi:DNA adenine methylase